MWLNGHMHTTWVLHAPILVSHAHHMGIACTPHGYYMYMGITWIATFTLWLDKRNLILLSTYYANYCENWLWFLSNLWLCHSFIYNESEAATHYMQLVCLSVKHMFVILTYCFIWANEKFAPFSLYTISVYIC